MNLLVDEYCRKDKSLGVLSQKFLMMFLVSEVRTKNSVLLVTTLSFNEVVVLMETTGSTWKCLIISLSSLRATLKKH